MRILILWFMPITLPMVSLKHAYEMGLSILRCGATITEIDRSDVKEIAHLNDAELQSLSYGTDYWSMRPCMGVADRVTMKLRNIQLENPSLKRLRLRPILSCADPQVMPCLLMDQQHRQLISQFFW